MNNVPMNVLPVIIAGGSGTRLRPYAITNMLDLLHPMYRCTAAYGHFGRNSFEMTVGDDTFTAFPWEKTDKVDALRGALQ